MNSLETLQDFIKRAERNYKYKPNTAAALANTLKLFAGVMTEDELSDGNFPSAKLDEIAERIHVKHPDKYSVDSLLTYKSRINRVVRDFEKYGSDAKSMASWNPLTKQRSRGLVPKSMSAKKAQSKTVSDSTVSTEKQNHNVASQFEEQGGSLQDIRLPLADNRSVAILYPTDLSEEEAEKIGIVLKGIAALNK